jgi:hypothetical protein
VKARSSNFIAVGTAFLLASAPASAHHSFAADFDAAKPVSLTGTLTKMEWTNPHAHIHLDVTSQAGLVTSWNVELATPNVLMRGGWLRSSLKSGDRVTVNGHAAKDGSRLVNATSVTTGDGRLLFARASASSP